MHGRQKKRIREKRLLKYVSHLRQLSKWLGNRDFRAVTQRDVEEFIVRLEDNRLTRTTADGVRPARYSAWTQRDFKVALRKFYTWLLGDGKNAPALVLVLVAWIDTHIEHQVPDSLSRAEVGRLAEYARTVRGKALIWMLFETRARIEEFFNIRYGHIEEKGDHFLVHIEYPKTFKRCLSVYDGAPYLRAVLARHPEADPAAPVFTTSYPTFRQWPPRGARARQARPCPLAAPQLRHVARVHQSRTLSDVQAHGLGDEQRHARRLHQPPRRRRRRSKREHPRRRPHPRGRREYRA